VSNVGTTVAHDVTFEFEPPIASTFDKASDVTYRLDQLVLLNEGISTLPPGKRFSTLFDSMPERFKSDLPNRYEVTVRFKGARGRIHEPMTYTLDLGVYYGMTYANEFGTHQAAKALTEINQTLKKWTEHGDGVLVYARDEDVLRKRMYENYLERKAEFEARHRPAGDGDERSGDDGDGS
jgi:hypothetical protein